MSEQKPLELTALGKAVTQLDVALAALLEEPENLFIRDAVIQRFEFTYELAIRVLRRFLRENAISFDEIDLLTFKEVIRLGAKLGLLQSGLPEWGDYRQARTETVHTYNEIRAAEVAQVAYAFAVEARYLFEKSRRSRAMNNVGTLNLEPRDLEILLRILAHRIPDRDVYVFGSRATGSAGRLSDLDLAIAGKLTLRQRAELTEDFDESDLPIEVDFVDFAVLTPVFRKRIEEEWIPLVKGTTTPNEKQVAA